MTQRASTARDLVDLVDVLERDHDGGPRPLRSVDARTIAATSFALAASVIRYRQTRSREHPGIFVTKPDRVERRSVQQPLVRTR